ncbi:hypothetical protein E4U35_003540 [Claviceps purpurea]|nr:hypothetical protein E4U35_003540 [Claviceps purpurea]
MIWPFVGCAKAQTPEAQVATQTGKAIDIDSGVVIRAAEMEDERWIDAVRQNPITGYITSFYAMAERMGVKERADLKSLSAITANQ